MGEFHCTGRRRKHSIDDVTPFLLSSFCAPHPYSSFQMPVFRFWLFWLVVE